LFSPGFVISCGRRGGPIKTGAGDPERLSSGVQFACRGQFDRPLAQTLSGISKPLPRFSRIKYNTYFALAQDIVP
jgi:hypothetical protein